MEPDWVEVVFHVGPDGGLDARIDGDGSVRAAEPGFTPQALDLSEEFVDSLAHKIQLLLDRDPVLVIVSYPAALAAVHWERVISRALLRLPSGSFQVVRRGGVRLRASDPRGPPQGIPSVPIDQRERGSGGAPAPASRPTPPLPAPVPKPAIPAAAAPPPHGQALPAAELASDELDDALREAAVGGTAGSEPPTDDFDDALQEAAVERSADMEAPADLPERRADIALYRTDSQAQWVGKDTCLRQDTRYRLRVLIGSPQAGTLMAAPPPAIDPLLPAPAGDGYALTVMVNGEDFIVEGSNTVPLFLPLRGASKPVDILVRTPGHPGEASLYVAVAFQGNVLQSFVLQAVIDAAETVREGKTLLEARLLFSNTARFSNLTSLRERALSIGVGDPRPGETTPLRLSGRATSVSIRLAELMTAQQITEYRRILEEATFDGQGPRFLSYPSAQTPQRPGIEEVLRTLARLGSQLYRGFYMQADTVKAALDVLLRTEDRTIQILRYNTTQTFPWAALYDYPEPEELAGAPAPVCLGYGHGAAPGAEPPRCDCPQTDRWCARGFWGIRHHIEELIGKDTLEDAVLAVGGSLDQTAIGLALGTRDEPVKAMVTKLEQLGHPVDLDLQGNLLTTLWQPDRPGICIVLGHMATANVQGEPIGPRIVLLPGRRFLQDKKIIDFRRIHGQWTQPRSVVMVLACTAGTTQPATVTDFMLAFHNAGAGAVVGTECTVFSGLLARFATEVTGALVGGASLGAAVTGFRRRLIREKNPLGFVFNAIGNADLTLSAG